LLSLHHQSLGELKVRRQKREAKTKSHKHEGKSGNQEKALKTKGQK
jgi:hypothetical protein